MVQLVGGFIQILSIQLGCWDDDHESWKYMFQGAQPPAAAAVHCWSSRPARQLGMCMEPGQADQHSSFRHFCVTSQQNLSSRIFSSTAEAMSSLECLGFSHVFTEWAFYGAGCASQVDPGSQKTLGWQSNSLQVGSGDWDPLVPWRFHGDYVTLSIPVSMKKRSKRVELYGLVPRARVFGPTSGVEDRTKKVELWWSGPWMA